MAQFRDLDESVRARLLGLKRHAEDPNGNPNERDNARRLLEAAARKYDVAIADIRPPRVRRAPAPTPARARPSRGRKPKSREQENAEWMHGGIDDEPPASPPRPRARGSSRFGSTSLVFQVPRADDWRVRLGAIAAEIAGVAMLTDSTREHGVKAYFYGTREDCARAVATFHEWESAVTIHPRSFQREAFFGLVEDEMRAHISPASERRATEARDDYHEHAHGRGWEPPKHPD